MIFERYTEKAIKVVMLASEEAKRSNHNFMGTEQILLGLIGERTGVAGRALAGFYGVNLADARAQVDKIIGNGLGPVSDEIPFTPRAKRVLDLAWDEARQLGHNYIGTEHLLLGLIREGEGVGALVLEKLGVDLSKVRSHVLRVLGESGAVVPIRTIHIVSKGCGGTIEPVCAFSDVKEAEFALIRYRHKAIKLDDGSSYWLERDIPFDQTRDEVIASL